MAGKQPTIQVQKQLLASESEVHRAHLSLEWQALKEDGRALAHVGRKIGVWVASAAVLTSLVKSRGQKKKKIATTAKTKTSWTKRLLGGAKLASTVWKGFRAAGR